MIPVTELIRQAVKAMGKAYTPLFRFSGRSSALYKRRENLSGLQYRKCRIYPH